MLLNSCIEDAIPAQVLFPKYLWPKTLPAPSPKVEESLCSMQGQIFVSPFHGLGHHAEAILWPGSSWWSEDVEKRDSTGASCPVEGRIALHVESSQHLANCFDLPEPHKEVLNLAKTLTHYFWGYPIIALIALKTTPCVISLCRLRLRPWDTEMCWHPSWPEGHWYLLCVRQAAT